jgi:homocysteine S-methyltransferase
VADLPSSGALGALLAAPGPPALLDGGLSAQLEAAGRDLSGSLWSARLLADEPQAIEDAHLAFLRAGARVITTASYQASRAGFARLGIDAAQADALLARSVQLARRARERFLAERPQAPRPLVAASVGPYGALLAGGQEYSGDYGDVTPAQFERVHAERLAALIAAGPDCIACETLPRADEAALLARLLDRLDAPQAWVSFACRDGRSTAHGEPIEAAVGAALGGGRVVAVGVNCTAPEHVTGLLRRARSVCDLPLVAYPNGGGGWDAQARAWVDARADCFPPALVDEWVGAGARLVGGCCGIGPAGIAALAPALAGAAARRLRT